MVMGKLSNDPATDRRCDNIRVSDLPPRDYCLRLREPERLTVTAFQVTSSKKVHVNMSLQAGTDENPQISTMER